MCLHSWDYMKMKNRSHKHDINRPRSRHMILLKKSVYFVGTYSGSLFNLFFIPSWLWSCFCMNREKNQFSSSSFPWPLWRIFIKELTFCSKTACVRLWKENLFCSNTAPEIHIFNSFRRQKLLLVANQLQDNTFFIC